MAINPETQYPGQITPSSPAYPYGQARNITVPGDLTGTPWEAALTNDLLGFQQALLSDAGAVPTGTPDEVGASQYLDALKTVVSYTTAATFATATDLAAGISIGGAPVNFDELSSRRAIVATQAYVSDWVTGTKRPYGGAFYTILTAVEYGAVPDGLGDFYVGGASDYVAVLMGGQNFIEQFGADPTGTVDSTANIVAALTKETVVRAGPGNFEIGDITLAPNQGVIGSGKIATVFTHVGAAAAFKAAAISTARNFWVGMTVLRSGATAASIGVDLTDSSFCLVHDLQTSGFNIGLIDNFDTGPSSFSARNTISHFEFNANNTGVLSQGGNANSYLSGRIWNSVIGLDLDDTEALNFVGINLESNTTQVRGRNGAKASFTSGYIEAGGGNVNFDVDSTCDVSFYSPQINGQRGIFAVNPNSTPSHSDLPDTAAAFAKYSMIPAADRQYIKNPDFSRPLTNSIDSWLESAGIIVATQTAGRESGSRYVELTSTLTGSKYLSSFTLERDATNLAIAVRYWQRSGTARFQVIQNAIILAQYTTDGSVDTGWNTALMRVPASNPVDPDGGDLMIEIFPDVVGGIGQVDVDQVWCVKGDYVSAPRGYGQSVEVLRSPVLLVDKTLVAVNQVDVITPADPPATAMGMRLRVILQTEQAATVITEYTFGGTNISIQPALDNTNVMVEVTVPAITITGSLLITSALNRATYKIELIEWILE